MTSPRVLSIKHLKVKTRTSKKCFLSKTANSTVISFVKKKKKKNKALSLSVKNNAQPLGVFDNKKQTSHALTKTDDLIQASS